MCFLCRRHAGLGSSAITVLISLLLPLVCGVKGFQLSLHCQLQLQLRLQQGRAGPPPRIDYRGPRTTVEEGSKGLGAQVPRPPSEEPTPALKV